MPVDPNIPLAGNNNGLNWAGPISLADLALKTQQVKMQQQKIAGQNALASIFSNPQNLDPSGNLTPQALQQVTAIDPGTGMQIRQQSIEDQLKRAQTEHFKTEAGTAKWSALSGLAGVASDAYDDAKAKGASEQDARAAGVAARNSAADNNGGTLSDDDVKGVVSAPFDPLSAKAFARSNKEWAGQKTKATEDALKDKQETERERHDTASEANVAAAIAGREGKDPTATKWQVLSDKDGTQYRYNPETAVATTLDGKSYSPKGAAKIGAATPEGAALTDEEKTQMAQQYLAGDKSVMQNLGRGTQGSANIAALRGEIAKQAAMNGMDGADIAAKLAEFGGITAGERTLGTRTANVGLAVDEAKKLAPLAIDASRAVSRSAFVPFAKAEQVVQKGTNDEDLRRFVAANNSLINVYARGISPTGTPTVSDKEHGREMLDTAYDQKSYEAVVDQMMKEMTAAQSAPGDVRKEFNAAVTGKSDGGKSTMFVVGKPDGLIKAGNIDLASRPSVKNADGSISTVRSITITEDDGKAILIPTVIGDKVVSSKEAVDYYNKTGHNLGVFKNEAAADKYAESLHEQQSDMYVGKKDPSKLSDDELKKALGL